MVVHIIVAVEVADQGSENEGRCGGKKDHSVEEGGGESAQLVVIGTCLGLLSAGIDGQHD